MLQTGFKGSKYLALLDELRSLGAGGIFFRVNYELSKKLGFMEKKHRAGRLSAEEVIGSLDFENPVLTDVRRAYDSRRIEGAIAELVRHFRFRESPKFFFKMAKAGLPVQ